MKQKEIVENIGSGGDGGEAQVMVQLRNIFPGMIGNIRTDEPVVVALREDYNNQPGVGERMFLRHLLVKKLDDYFYRLGKYKFPHVPRVFGSVSGNSANGGREGYLYEWVFGREYFPWENMGPGGVREPVMLSEWSMFVSLFDEAGIKMSIDVADADNARLSKNIIHELYKDEPDLNLCWKRIDFGPSSLVIDGDKLKKFLAENEQSLIQILSTKRRQLLVLIQRYLFERDQMSEEEEIALRVAASDYCWSSVRHLIAQARSQRTY